MESTTTPSPTLTEPTTPTISSARQRLLDHYNLHLSDYGNTQRFLQQHRDHVRYVPSHGWFTWDGTRWQHDADGLRITHLALQTILSLAQEAAVLPADQHKLATDLLVHARRSENPSRLKALLALASTDPTIQTSLDAFDAHPHLLNVNNGTFDFRTRELRPHNPADLLTRLAPFDYHPNASSPLWNDFVEQIAHQDPHLRDYLQRAMGYTLSATTEEQLFFLLHGSGRNGKHTFLAAIAHALGDYAHTTPLSTFARTPGVSSSTRASQLASLPATRLVFTSCTDAHPTLDLATICQFTPTDPVPVPRGRGSYTFLPQFVLWLTTAHLPLIPDASTSLWDRLRLIPFPVSFADRATHRLAANLRAVAPAILTWLIQGHALWAQHGLHEPDCVSQATRSYRQEQDRLAHFIRDTCTIDPECSTPAHDLYLAYASWSRQVGERPRSETAFCLDLQAHGYQRERKNFGKLYHGLALLPPPDPPALPPSPTRRARSSVPGSSPVSSHAPSMPALPTISDLLAHPDLINQLSREHINAIFASASQDAAVPGSPTIATDSPRPGFFTRFFRSSTPSTDSEELPAPPAPDDPPDEPVPTSPSVSPHLGWGERISHLNAPRLPGLSYAPDYPQ